ncbi:hypothetical protein ACFE04_024827 [Oxalis oulophora]
MGIKSLRRRLGLSISSLTDNNYNNNNQAATQQSSSSSSSIERFRSRAMSFTKIFAAGFATLPLLLTLALIFRRSPSDQLSSGFAEARSFSYLLTGTTGNSESTSLPKDELLGQLLASGFEPASCLSRYQAASYRKISPYKPSSYLISKLRNYETLHKRCGPHTQSYNKSLEQLNAGHLVDSPDCKYLVWVSFSGLGNRILSLTSAFLYAFITNRVLLVDRGKDVPDLFCEPFPESSWLLPVDFPLTNQFSGFSQDSPNCYSKMLKNNALNASMKSVPSYLYLHLVHDYSDHDKLFFCDDDQALLEKIPWLVMKTDNYFVPSLFLTSSFALELSKLFPDKGAVFHHLGRYLLHPTNKVWGLITRYYDAYLARADERIGIQIRVFDTRPGPFQYVMNQILACTHGENILPALDLQGSVNIQSERKTKAVLMTSLSSGYFEMTKNLYWENPTVTGDMIGVFQPSYEGYQQTEKGLHNMKAWAEMYLLSLTDKLVTSSWSTFGYVAQGLGGLKPWILYKPENETAPSPACRRAMSMEPCFHSPPYYDCKAKKGTDTGEIVPHVRHCEDISWGLKLVDSHDMS